MTENKIVGWYHRLNGPEFEQALGVGDGQGGLACCSPWLSPDLFFLLNDNLIFNPHPIFRSTLLFIS